MSFLVMTHLEFPSSHIKPLLYSFDSVSELSLAQLKEYQKQPPASYDNVLYIHIFLSYEKYS